MQELTTNKIQTERYHRFLDEAGDTTFYAKGRVPMLGNEGKVYLRLLFWEC